MSGLRSVVTMVGVRVGVLTELVWMFRGNMPGFVSWLRCGCTQMIKKKPMGEAQASTSPPQ